LILQNFELLTDQDHMAFGQIATSLVACVVWFIVFGVFRVVTMKRERDRMGGLHRQLAEADRANQATVDLFRNRLRNHDTILAKIIQTSDRILNSGITDPNLTLDDVRLIGGHARDARALIEETTVEFGLGTGRHDLATEKIDVRREVDAVSSLFAPGSVSTTGPHLGARTVGPMFRVLLRSLIAAAVARGSDEIDVAVAHDGSAVLCTVSDDAGVESVPCVPPLAAALAAALDTDITSSRRMRRNHYTVSLPAAAMPTDTVAPLDVLGARASVAQEDDPVPTRRRPVDRSYRIEFAEPFQRDENQTVAARRRTHLLNR
jgi:hypothetical protein